MSKKEALLYQKRWRAVHAIQIQELRAMSVLEKFSQFMTLLSVWTLIPKPLKNKKEETKIRNRWLRLRARTNE